MNLGEARSALTSRGFDYLTGSAMNLMLNAAKEEFEDAWTWPWLEASASAVAPVDLGDLKYVRSVKYADTELFGLSAAQVAEGDTRVTLAGAPVYWYLVESVAEHVNLFTYPTSTGKVSVAYIRRTPALAAATDTPLIPSRHHPTWIDLAVVQAYQDSDNFVAAQALRAAIAQRMQSIIETYETRNRQHSVLMSVRDLHDDD